MMKTQNKILFTISFFFCILAFLAYRQMGFSFDREKNIVEIPLKTVSTSTVSSSQIFARATIDENKKILKNFGQCGSEDKNDIILSYPPDLVNALLDGIFESHCQSPNADFPNYTFLLKDPSLVRLAEMTPDFQNIFYLTARESGHKVQYTLYRVDTRTKITQQLDQYEISSDWSLQRDFYEAYLMPKSIAGGKYFTYNWFLQDPKGRNNVQEYLRGKVVVAEKNQTIQSPCGYFGEKNIIFAPNYERAILACDTGKENNGKNVILFYATNFSAFREVKVPQNPSAPRHFDMYFIDNDTFVVGYGGLPFVIDLPKF